MAEKTILLSAERGIGKFTLLVFGLLVGATLYCAYNIIPFYYYYYELLNQMDSATRIASSETDEEIRKRLLYHIKHMGIPMNQPEDLKIERHEDRMRISMDYVEEFFIQYKGKDIYSRQFPFHAEVDNLIK